MQTSVHLQPRAAVCASPSINSAPRPGKTKNACRYMTARYNNVNYEAGEVTLPIPVLADSQLLHAVTDHIYPLGLRHNIELARLMLDAGLVSQKEVTLLLDIAAMNELDLSEIVCIFSVLTSHTRNLCDELLREVEIGDLTYDQVITAANHIHFTGCSIMEAHALVGSYRRHWSILELLEAAGLIAEPDIDALAPLISDSNSITNLLLDQAILSDRILQIATRLRYLVKSGQIDLAQAVVAIRQCTRDLIDVDDFLVERGWKIHRSPPVLPMRSASPALSIVA